MKKIIVILTILFLFVGCGRVQKRGNQKISRHFTFYEATYSSYGKRHRISNYPTRADYKRIRSTAQRMERIRKIVGKQIHINSWYRGYKINRRVGGSSTSAHTKGLAVDFKVNGSEREAFNRIIKSGYSYDQIIYYSRKGYIHISFKENPRNETRKRNYI